MKNEVNATTLNAMVDAMGSIVRALVATLPPAQQKVFLLRMVDASESALAKNDLLLMELINDLLEIGRSEQRPESAP
ncbi:MAG: hypothetical protein KAX59_02980 [Acidovorax sp.]|nr:hypothetical protein [Acidovorax sp.]